MRSLRLLAAAATTAALATALATAPLAAQSAAAGASSDPTIARIWRLGMDSSHVQQLSQALFDSVGPRLTGSPGLREASDWVIAN
jgi:carboxypeptidase Q